MKHYLQSVTILLGTFLFFQTNAQVTRLAINCNMQGGASLGSVAIMVDSLGKLWKTDGTPAGTSQFTSKVIFDQDAGSYVVFNSKLYFAGINLAGGSELWVTDGTDAGTLQVKDIESGANGSSPSDLMIFNNKIYFFASTAASGREMWMSDGTSGGTSQLADINPGSADSYNTNTTTFINGSTLYFTVDDGTNGNELWKTNGTASGTSLVKDINQNAGSSDPSGFYLYNGKVYFSADDGVHGAEVWQSDGTGGGTVILKDIVNGADGSSPSDFLTMNNKLYFTAVKPLNGGLFSFQIWSSDGSGSGTSKVYDYGLTFNVPLFFYSVIINNKLYFENLDYAQNETKIWVTDGTSAGTLPFKDFNTGGDDSALLFPDLYSAYFAAGDYHSKLFNGKIFLTATNGTNGSELWITDGTNAGTMMVKDINSGSESSFDLNNIGFYTQSGMYFPANDGAHGLELWKSDGTGSGTNIVKDINPGGGSSFDSYIMFFNGHLYISADENGDGYNELFKVDATDVLPLKLLDLTATLNGKAVQLDWTTSNEINTKDFTIQRSYDAQLFNNVGSVTASGNTTQKTDYRFIDAGAMREGISKIYYRLQMNDKDGNHTTSKIVSVTLIPQDKLIAAYPNPVRDCMNLTFNIVAPSVNVKIIDQNGKAVYQQQLTNVQPGSVQKINTGALKGGVYYVQWSNGNDIQSFKIVKY